MGFEDAGEVYRGFKGSVLRFGDAWEILGIGYRVYWGFRVYGPSRIQGSGEGDDESKAPW